MNPIPVVVQAMRHIRAAVHTVDIDDAFMNPTGDQWEMLGTFLVCLPSPDLLLAHVS